MPALAVHYTRKGQINVMLKLLSHFVPVVMWKSILVPNLLVDEPVSNSKFDFWLNHSPFLEKWCWRAFMRWPAHKNTHMDFFSGSKNVFMQKLTLLLHKNIWYLSARASPKPPPPQSRIADVTVYTHITTQKELMTNTLKPKVFLLHAKSICIYEVLHYAAEPVIKHPAAADKPVLRNAATHHSNRSYVETSWDLENNSICYCRSSAAARGA